MPHLVVREPGRVALTVELHADFSIGRDPENDLVVADTHASRRHVKFTLVGGGSYQIEDLGSTHGLLINRVPTEKHVLTEGDVIQIGNVLIIYHRADAPGEASIIQSITGDQPVERGASPEARRLHLLYDLGRAMGAVDEPDGVIIKMLDAALEELACERGVIGLVDAGSSSSRRIARSRGGTSLGRDGDDIVISRTLLDHVLKRGQSVLLDTSGPETPITVVREGVKSAMAAPLKGARRIVGFVYVDDRARRDRFGQPELEFLTALARLAATALEQGDEQRRSVAVAEALRDSNPIPEIIGESAPMQKLKGLLAKYAAAAHSPVLIRGESGTGKELAATTIHMLSSRASQPLVTVNCAAIPESLIESELFGHEKGAFTGAIKARRGKFQMAHKGTLFLDEIGDLSLAAQAKVLRAIQQGEVQPLGAEKIVEVDVRVVSATNKSLIEEIAAKRFREDLYYRLSVGELELPPVRARGDDVVLLARAYLRHAATRVGKHVTDFSPAAVDALRRYGWPGNVRQLHNEIERAVILAEGSLVELEELRSRIAPPVAGAAPGSPALTIAERFAQLDVTERQLVEEALAQAPGNVSEAARLLGISRIMLRRRMERFGLAGGE